MYVLRDTTKTLAVDRHPSFVDQLSYRIGKADPNTIIDLSTGSRHQLFTQAIKTRTFCTCNNLPVT